MTEARDAGLITTGSIPATWEDAIGELRSAMNESPEKQLSRYEESVEQAELVRLNDQRVQLREQLRRQQVELDSMRSLLKDEGGYSKETGEHVSRLSSLGIFAATDSGCCPLCDQPTSDRIPSTLLLKSELDRASSQLESVAKQAHPGLEALIVEQEAKLAETRRLLKENRKSKEALRLSDDRLTELRDTASRRALVLGRISLFLETLPQIADSSELRREIEQLQAEVDQIEADLSDAKLQERLDSMLSVIGKKLTTWAERLEHEHAGNPF